MNNIICVAGPTASGKTSLAVALAKELNGEVISCDSMQIYRGMDIGTAKPTTEEMEGIPHHMLDVVSPADDFSVSRYCEMADPILQDILSRGKTAVLAGGTGLYVDALISGREFAPVPSTGVREKLEAQADAEGMETMTAWLRSVDPEAADRIHDRKRILRALEVFLETGETITEHNRKTQAIPPKYKPLQFALEDENRQDLYDRIDKRVDLMLELGLMDEIHRLLASGIPEKCTAMQAIGYKEFLDAVHGHCTVQEAADLVKQSSRRYAKRQLTWLRRNEAIHWLRRKPGQTTKEIVAAALQVVAESDN